MPRKRSYPDDARYANLIYSVQTDLAMVVGVRPEMIEVHALKGVSSGHGEMLFDGPHKRMVALIELELRLFEHAYNTNDYIALLAMAGHELSHSLYTKANQTDQTWRELSTANFQHSSKIQSCLVETFCDLNGMRLAIARLGQPINVQILSSFRTMVTPLRTKTWPYGQHKEQILRDCNRRGCLLPSSRAMILGSYQGWSQEAAVAAVKTYVNQLWPQDITLYQRAEQLAIDLTARGWPTC